MKSLLATTLVMSLPFFSLQADAPGARPYIYCGTGDHIWNHHVEPVDSEATLDALCEWSSITYGSKRLYWRGGQEDYWHHYFDLGIDNELDVTIRDWLIWSTHLYKDKHLSQSAIKAAKKHGMEVFMYTGLFEYGTQSDVGVIQPHLFEDRLRREHPEWIPLDRWGQRRSPGPLCFGYPEVRKILIDRLMKQVREDGYDGINFYTYVENIGIRYEDEFGFNQPIVDEFQKKYPGVDLRTAKLTREQKRHWYKVRGRFVTQYLRELKAELAKENKKLSMILDAEEPDYAQRWWGKKLHGAGRITMEWRQWIKEGIVDEIWVQLAAVEDQTALIDTLLEEIKGTPIKLTVRAVDPLGDVWKPYVAKGVTPIGVITWEKNGIERLTLEKTSSNTLRSPNWMLRAQTLADIGHGEIKATVTQVEPLTRDAHVLVRHRSAKALGAIGGPVAAAALEKLLEDPESSVRIAAAEALKKTHRPESTQALLAALEKDHYHQFKMVAGSALGAIGSYPELAAAVKGDNLNVRDVAVRALYTVNDPQHQLAIYEMFRGFLNNPEEARVLRQWAALRLSPLYVRAKAQLPEGSPDRVTEYIELIAKETDPVVQLNAVRALTSIVAAFTAEQKAAALEVLEKQFRTYGDAATRSDRSFGWRVIGNAMLALGGKEKLDALRTQKDDRWLAWNAYEVVYLYHDRVLTEKGKGYSFNEVTEEEAIANQKNFAPAFPGWRF